VLQTREVNVKSRADPSIFAGMPPNVDSRTRDSGIGKLTQMISPRNALARDMGAPGISHLPDPDAANIEHEQRSPKAHFDSRGGRIHATS
jgi:hypothetical protein